MRETAPMPMVALYGPEATDARRAELTALLKDAARAVCLTAALVPSTHCIVFGRPRPLYLVMPPDAADQVAEETYTFGTVDREYLARWLETLERPADAEKVLTGPPGEPCPEGWRLSVAALDGIVAVGWVAPARIERIEPEPQAKRGPRAQLEGLLAILTGGRR